jgi:hypothetical protein
MALLSQELTTILNNASGNDIALAAGYKREVSQSVDALDAIGAPPSQASPSDRLEAFLRASNVLFPGRALVPDDKEYNVAKERNWYVKTRITGVGETLTVERV